MLYTTCCRVKTQVTEQCNQDEPLCLLLKYFYGIPGWLGGLAPAFGPGRDPGDLGSSPASRAPCVEPASHSAVSLALSLSVSHE